MGGAIDMTRVARAARFAVLTPEGRGAIAVVRVWGAEALAVVAEVFRPATGKPLDPARPNVPRFGRVGAGLGDEVVVTVVPGDPPEVEIHGHGGAAVALVTDALEAAGAGPVWAWGWVWHDAPTDLEGEARIDLAGARTLRTAEILLEQSDGALAREVERVAGLIERHPGQALDAIERLRRRLGVGIRLVRGWSVALAGRPNVGKSSLLNALAGYDRAIVAPTPGTTRDVVSVATAFDGWPVELWDTAGLRAADDAVEAEGVERARAWHARADLTLLVLDRSGPLTQADRDLLMEYPDALVVANKCDLTPAWGAEDLGPSKAVRDVSARRGDGIDGLAEAVARRLVPDPPAPGEAVPFRPRHARCLGLARENLLSGDADHARACLGHLSVRSVREGRAGSGPEGQDEGGGSGT